MKRRPIPSALALADGVRAQVPMALPLGMYQPEDHFAPLERAMAGSLAGPSQTLPTMPMPVATPAPSPMPAVDPYATPQPEPRYYEPAQTTAQDNLPGVDAIVASAQNDVRPPLLPPSKNPTTAQIQQLIVQKARAMGLPPDIALGQVEQESTFNPNATGGAGEYGLFQIHPNTAPTLGLSKAEAYDINKNIDAGLRYFAKMMKLTGGDVIQALRAYNGGPGNWLNKRVSKQAIGYADSIKQRAEKYRQYAMR